MPAANSAEPCARAEQLAHESLTHPEIGATVNPVYKWVRTHRYAHLSQDHTAVSNRAEI